MTSTASAPAVLSVTYQVRADGADEFTPWLALVRADAAAADGFLGVGVDTTPGDSTEEWVASFKFDSAAALDAWTGSAGRADLQSRMPDALEGVPLEHRDTEGGLARASEVITATVPPAQQAEYKKQRAALDAKAATYPGFVSVDVFQPSGEQDTWNTILTFDSAASLQSWRDSPERAALVGQIKSVASDSDRVMPTGFGQWFSVNATATAQSPAWKQAMVVLAVLYAMVSVLDITLGNFIGKGLSVEGDEVVPGLGLPFPVVVFVGNAVGTILLTWVLMPIVTRLLAWWLDPAATSSQTTRGALLMIVIYILEMLFFVWLFRTFGF
ncbi:MAG: antibiotic biosynthesis monooxygenase [Candidatus Nanopelagicales bacterium]